eukprot:536858_1
MNIYCTSKYQRRVKSKQIKLKKSLYKCVNTNRSTAKIAKQLKQKKWITLNRNTNKHKTQNKLLENLKKDCNNDHIIIADNTYSENNFKIFYQDKIPMIFYRNDFEHFAILEHTQMPIDYSYVGYSNAYKNDFGHFAICWPVYHSLYVGYPNGYNMIGTSQLKEHKLSKYLRNKEHKIVAKLFHKLIMNINIDTLLQIELNMDTHHDECLFWYKILNKLGIIEQLVYSSYLQRCTKKLFADNFEFLSDELIYTNHIFYILNEIERQADCLFINNYKHSNKVIMTTQQLIDILYCNNNCNIGRDICQLIALFTARNTNDILLFLSDYTRKENNYKNTRTTTRKYDRYGHHIIDTELIEHGYFYHSFYSETELIRKIFDGRDITSHYYYVKDLLLNVDHYIYSNVGIKSCWKKLLYILWQKIKEIYSTKPSLIQPLLICKMMIYYVDYLYVNNIEILHVFTFKYHRKCMDLYIWNYLYKNMKSKVCKNILVLINNALIITDTQKPNFM